MWGAGGTFIDAWEAIGVPNTLIQALYARGWLKVGHGKRLSTM
jgi:hypothetical protein